MDNCHHNVERRNPEQCSSQFEYYHNSMINMANPTDVRNAFHQIKRHWRHGKDDGHVEFDNPFGQHQEKNWSCAVASETSADPETLTSPWTAKSSEPPIALVPITPETLTAPEIQTIQEIQNNPEIQTNQETQNNPETPADLRINLSMAPTANAAELTQLSEQLLPVHSNGYYSSETDWERLHLSNVQKAVVAAQNGSKMVLLGDSITEALGYNNGDLQPFQQAFPGDNPVGLGLGGDGTKQLLYRLNHGEMQGEPQTAVVMIGTNDIGSLSSEQIAENTANIIKSIQARSPNTKIVLMGILPRPENGDPGNVNVDATNAVLSRLATANGSVQFVNLRNLFVDANGNERQELYQADKLHLSNAGYETWAGGLKSAIG